MSDKLKKICGYLLGGYAFCAVLFCWLANEHINYDKLDARHYGIVQEEDTPALVGDVSVEQTFTVETDRINEVFLLLTTFDQPGTKGNIYVELLDPATNTKLAKSKCEIKNIANNAWRGFRLGENVAEYLGQELVIKAYTDVDAESEGNRIGIGFQRQTVEGAGELVIGGTVTEGVLEFYIMGANVSGHAVFYYIAFGLIFIVLMLYCAKQIAAARKGQMTLGLKLAYTVEKYWFLMEQLIARDFKTKYKRSVLGVFWSFLNPLLMMVIQYVVFVNLFKFNVDNYAVYLLTGIVMYNGMSDTTTQAMSSITGNASLITKVYVPKYIYPVSKVLSTSINLLLSMLPLMLVAIFTGLAPKWSWLLLPYAIVCQIVFTIGVSFVLSSLMVFFRDMQFLWGVFTTAWMYATPIMYPISILPGLMQQLERVNPMYHYITFMRTIIIDGIAPSPDRFLACALFAVAAFVIGSIVFKKTQDQFVLYI